MTGLQAEFLEGLQWQEQATRLAGKGTKAIALIKRLRTFVLASTMMAYTAIVVLARTISADRVEEQRLANPAPLLLAIDGETAEHGGRHGIMRQPLCQGRRQFALFEARGAQTVIAGDLLSRVPDRHEHLRNAPPDILRGLSLKVPVESRFPA